EMAASSVFAEPALDDHWHEKLPAGKDAKVFASEYLPGQYDQRADSAAQCIRIIKPEAKPIVKFARVYALYGDITEEELDKVIEYCINPVDSGLADDKKPVSLEMETVIPDDVSRVKGFVKMDEARLEELRKEMGFAMSKADLMHIHDYFSKEEKRDPSLTELLVIDTYWSDHCRHTTFNTGLSNIYFEESPYGELVRNAFQEYMEMRNSVYGDRKKDVCLMDMACIGAKYLRKQGKADDIDESEEVNACSIKVRATVDGQEEDWLVMFKNETHNHPTEIEPFGGAATCLGGAIRDPLSGRVYVYQAMRVTGAADPGTPVSETIKGKLPQRKITRQAAEGYSSYGNQIGLATGHVDEIYDEDYVAKR
nr:phosphoribosylformylglycinamidine synthase [Bacillota bacterium]